MLADAEFQRRKTKPRDPRAESVALRRLARLFAQEPQTVLRELVDIAIDSCAADSAGISVEEPDDETFRWVVTAGSFSPFVGARMPRKLSPCGPCLDSGRPQLYTATQPYYDLLGVGVKPITDGIVIPWKNSLARGTLWAVSHSASGTFSSADYDLLSSLADFASIIIRDQRQQELLHEKTKSSASAEMAHKIAHRINNPLQSLTNTLFLARLGNADPQDYLAQAESELARLSIQVAALLDTAALFRPTEELQG